jgi:hypothetical protein
MSLSTFAWITGLLALLSGLLMIVLMPNASAGFVAMPGIIFGAYAMWGLTHGGNLLVLVAVTTLVNLIFYTGIAYGAGKIFFKKNR